jgi:transcription initiation factor TFIIIB Brf1 subunit/transcription initiation factor TFIIB
MSCGHPSYVEDDREGTVICTVCCQVIDQLYSYDTYQVDTFSQLPAFNVNIQAIQDICANFNIPSSIEAKCIEIYQDISTSKTKRFPKNVLIAFSVYQGLIEHNVARSPQEILCMTGVELSRIFEVETLLAKTDISDHPTSATYVERFGLQCGLSFSDIQYVLTNCKLADEICENYAPQTIAATLISCYCKLRKKSITVQTISKTCLVSSSSMYRIARSLSKHCKF